MSLAAAWRPRSLREKGSDSLWSDSIPLQNAEQSRAGRSCTSAGVVYVIYANFLFSFPLSCLDIMTSRKDSGRLYDSRQIYSQLLVLNQRWDSRLQEEISSFLSILMRSSSLCSPFLITLCVFICRPAPEPAPTKTRASRRFFIWYQMADRNLGTSEPLRLLCS